jgi:hypothetical protein
MRWRLLNEGNWFRFGDSGFVLIRDSLKLGGVWIIDQWPKAKIVDGSWT